MRSYIGTAIKEILLSGQPLSGIETHMLFATCIRRWVYQLRQQGFVFETIFVPLETVYRRLAEVFGQTVPRPRYLLSDKLVVEYRRNKSKETRNAPFVHQADADAAGVESRR